MLADNPQSLSEWWDYIKTDCPIGKTRYFLRNHGAFGFPLEDVIAFLAGKVPLKCHRSFAYAPCGSYSIEWPERCILLRIDPNSPGIHGPRNGVPSLCVTHDYECV